MFLPINASRPSLLLPFGQLSAKPARVSSAILTDANAAAVPDAGIEPPSRSLLYLRQFVLNLANGLRGLGFGLLFANSCFAANSSTENYPLPGHGQLRLEVPQDWQIKYVFTEDGRTPPSLHVFPLQGTAFEMTITVYWHEGLDQDIASPESLLRRVQQAGAEAQASAGVKGRALDIKKFTGNNRRGFFYDLKDPSASDGDFAYLTQGAFTTGQIVLAFTILTHSEAAPEREACLEFLRQLRQVYAHQGVSVLLPLPHQRQRT